MKWFWVILCLVPLPISAYFILTTDESNNVNILLIQILATISVLICQQFWYKYQWEECKFCYQARFIHQKKHLGFPGVCKNFTKKAWIDRRDYK